VAVIGDEPETMTISVMKHDAYIAGVKFDPEFEMFRGEVLNLAKGGFDFYADSVAGLKREFAKSAREYEAFCKECGDQPEKPLSGNFTLRVDTDLHAALTAQAKGMG
jgi:predicted HicB family RNase H-like nuclease